MALVTECTAHIVACLALHLLIL